MSSVRQRALAGLALAVLAPVFAWAQDTNAVSAPPVRKESPARWMSRQVTQAGDWLDCYIANAFSPKEAHRNTTFDRFYGDRQLEDEINRTLVSVSPSAEYQDSDGGGVSLHLRVKARLALPRSSGRLQLVFDSFNEESDVLDETLQRHPPQSDTGIDDQPTLSLRLSLRKTVHYRASLDTGVRFKPAPDPRVQLRFRVWKEVGPVVVRGTQAFFWEGEDGFGEKTQLDIERGSPSQKLVRATTSVLWSEASAGVGASEVLSYTHGLGRKRSIGLAAGVSTHVEPDAQVDKYTLQVPYRLRVHRNWLFMELTPGVDFPRERDFQESPFIVLKFIFVFGHTEDG